MISERLKRTILKTLDLQDWDISDETFAYEIPGWDSLTHVAVLVAVEKEFGIRFHSTETLMP
jgi:acyl carrier protein